MLVQHFLENSAERLPDKIALVCDQRRLTYAQVDDSANCLANAMRAHGLERHDRVALYLNNTVEQVAGIFGALKAMGTFVSINPTTKKDKLIYILNNCQASALYYDARQEDLIAEIVRGVPSLKMVIACGERGGTSVQEGLWSIPRLDFDQIHVDHLPTRPPCTNIDLDLACLIYTSGTTGEPKGVMSDHSNVVFAASSIVQYLENGEDDILINTLPLSFDYGLYQLLMAFKFGGRLILERGFAYPAMILKRIEDERVTGFPGVPTIFSILLRMDLDSFDLSSLRYLSNTAAALPPSHIQELRAKFPNISIFSMYGLTETKRTLYMPPGKLDQKPGSVGIAIPGTEVWIEEDGQRLGPGEVGELVVRGRHVMRGYWEAPESTAERYRPGSVPGERLCYSGDLFRMDEDGYFYFVSRKDDIIKTRGEKVAPKEVETVLYALPGVLEAAVIGVPDSILGQVPKAFLVIKNGIQINEKRVLAHCRAHLEDFMVPKYVEFRDELPKTSSGKIKKTDLQ